MVPPPHTHTSQPQQGERQCSLSPSSKPLYLEAEEQLGQCLDPLDKLWRERDMLVLCLKLYEVCMPVPGEMDKPEPTSDSRTVGRRGSGSVPRASACGDKRQSIISKGQSNTTASSLTRDRPCLVI